MGSHQEFHHRHWGEKFFRAAQGVLWGIRGRSTWIDGGFAFHLAATLAVVGLAAWISITAGEWALLLVCVGLVWTTELLNAAVEMLSRAVTKDYNREVEMALDTSAGAVLVASLIAATVAVIIFLPKFL
jgi:diacylglycerol kinase